MTNILRSAIFYNKKGKAILSSLDAPNAIAVVFREYPAAFAVNRRGARQTQEDYLDRFDTDLPIEDCLIKPLDGFGAKPRNIGGSGKANKPLTPEEYLPYQCNNCFALHFSLDLSTFIHNKAKRHCRPEDISSTLTGVIRF